MAGIDVKELMEEEDTQKGKFLTFSMESKMYGIDVRYVTEIIGIQPITEVPELPGYIKGIINLRGKIIPVMDVRLRFKMPFKEYNDRTCIIVIDIDGTCIGLIVDSVTEILSIPEDEIVDPPEVNKTGNNYIKCIGKVGNEMKLILDCYKLLNDREI
ncbi:chemotaxis protein CheW [Anaerocolumna sedimenticola]|uniref:Chemotaxis protein CheW n=1 Tax=Anaerocolumna sedimenticola TaxID=2696063 RepID=A0A6P1TSN0_9FIRM|nr:chemotaxis protein CheW [Anaerocolumna sedimenticola]QHQ63357.1 chemotaxis protein CheW [Anaerocolumna sedimenticola]